MTTSYPASAASTAAVIPAMPPPTTRMLRYAARCWPVSGVIVAPAAGPAIAGLRDQLDEGFLRQRPLPLGGVIARGREALPVRLVELREVPAVIIAGPARLLS